MMKSWLFRIAVVAIALPVILIGLLHTPPVRRAALAQLCSYLGQSRGIVLQARSLDYNLISQWLLLEKVSLGNSASNGMPSLLTAERVRLSFRFRDLMAGSVRAHSLEIDRLQLYATVRKDESTNFSGILPETSGRKQMLLPVDELKIADLSLSYHDEQAGFSAQLPAGTVSGSTNPATGDQEIIYSLLERGKVSWGGREIPVANLTLSVLLQDQAMKLQSLDMAGEGIEIKADGTLQDPESPRLNVLAHAGIEASMVSHWLGLEEPLAGRVQATLNVSGNLERLIAEGELRSDQLKLGRLQWDSFAAEGRFESATGMLELKKLTTKMNAEQIQASGLLSLSGQGQSTIHAEAQAVNLRRIGIALGWRAPPRGEASAQLTISCPGSQWKKADMAAAVKVAFSSSSGKRLVPEIKARLTGQLREQQVHLGLDSLSGYGANLQGFLDVGIADRSLAGELSGSIGSLNQLIHNLEAAVGKPADSLLPFPVDGSAELRAALSGNLQDPHASIDLEGTDLSAGRIAGAGLHLQGEYGSNRIFIRQVRLDWNGQAATASGEIGLASDYSPLHIEAAIDQVSIAETLLGLELDADVHATASAKVAVTGTRSHPQVSIVIEAHEIEAYGEPLGKLDAEAEWHDRRLTLTRLKLNKPQPGIEGMLEAHAVVNFDSREYEFNLAAENLQAVNPSRLTNTPVMGVLSLNADGKGNLDNPTIHAEADCKDLQIAGERVGNLRGVLQLSDHQARLSVEDEALGITAAADIATEGTFPIRFNLTAAKIPYSFTIGKQEAAVTSAVVAQGEGSLRPLHIQEASALLKDFQLEIGNKKIGSEEPLEVRYADQRLLLRPAIFISEGIKLHASADMPMNGDGEPGKISLTGDIGLNSIASLFSQENAIDARGKATLDAEVRGNWRSLTRSAILAIEGGYLHSAAFPEALEELNATVRLSDSRISIDPLSARIGKGAIRASAEIPADFLVPAFDAPASDAQKVTSLQPARFSITAEEVPLSLAAQPENPVGTFSAKITGESPRPTVDAITARLELTKAILQQGSFSIEQVEPSTFTMEDGRLHIDQWHWTGPQGELQLGGTVGLTGEYPLDFHISGKADAAICSLLSSLASGKGSLQMDLRLLGTVRDPLLSGFLEMDRGSIGITQPRLLIEDLNLRVELDAGRFEIRKLEGVFNGGRINGSGGASFRQGKLQTANVDLSGQGVFLEYPKGMKTSSNLRIQVRNGESDIVVGGEVDIREGSYVEQFDFSNIGTTDLIGKADSRSGFVQVFGLKVRYDIKIKTVQPVAINNNLAKLSARADMRLVGDPARPGMVGTISLDRGGKVYFGGRTYYIERGVVSFANEARIDPVYDLVATSQVNEYQVSLRLSGTGSEIAATYTSDPPLSQNDIIALLLTGKPQSESSGGRVDPAQAEKMSLVSGALNADLTARMRRRFGVSQVMIQPSLISEESDPGARLTIGQDLSESLQLVYSMNLVNSADQIWYAEYDFNRRFTARAVMQSDNTYRTDFQQDFRFGGRKSELSETSSAASRTLRVGKVEFSGNPKFETSRLAREFKISPGSKFNFAKSRKGVESLQKFYAKQGHLSARVYLDREDRDQQVNLTVQIEAGTIVRIEYEGAEIPGSIDKQVRQSWQEGISDRQRTEDAEQILRAHLAKRGYPKANIASRIDELSPDEKRVSFELQTGVHYKQVGIGFEGAAAEHAESIAVRLKQRKTADQASSRPESVIEDVTAYYRQKGYYLATVSGPRFEATENGETAKNVFQISEGPQTRIRSLDFQGNKALTTDELKKGLPLKEGSVLDPDQLQKTTTAIAEMYGKRGYRNPEITPAPVLDDKLGSVDLAFVIKEGVRSIIESVKVEGEDRISEKYINGQLHMAVGAPQDIPETNRSIRNLYNTGAFSQVDIVAVPDKSAPSGDAGTEKVDVVVKVQEVAPFKFLYGGYYDSGGGPGFIAEIEKRNLLGGARVIGLRSRYDADLQEVRMYYSQPLWFGRPRPTTGTVFYRNEKDYYEGLSAERIGFTLQQEINLTKKFVVSYGYRFENVDSWYSDQRAPNPPQAIVSPLTFSLTRSTRNDFLDPTNGSFTSVAVEYAPKFLGSTYGYSRVFGQYFKYFPLFKPGYVPYQEDAKKPRFIYATGIRLGLIKGLTTDQVIPTERFYAGGGTTVRGFKQDTLGPLDQYGNPLGGNAMLVLNNELRFPMLSIFDAVGFVDLGNVFPLASDFSFSELRKTAGFGLRLRTPSLMLRFDYGFKLDRRSGESAGAFFFSIGQAF
jgi:outer membrane protein assembly complex protein YaeT